MGRNIPSKEIITAPIHPLLSLAISVTCIAALVATISSLCGIWSKKSSKSSSTGNTKNTKTITTADLTEDIAQNSSSSKGKSKSSADNNATTTATITATNTTNDEEPTNMPLPPPPSAAKLEFGESAVIKKIDKSSSLKNYLSKTSTRRKLSSSISMKMSMKIKDKASDFKDKASEMKDKASDIKDKASEISHRKTKNDNDSLWTKRIILGEKCKLPNEDDDNKLNVSYDDEQGSDDSSDNNNVVARSGSNTRAMSRTVSCISEDSISSLRQEEKLRTNYNGGAKEKVQSDEEDDS